MTANDLYAPEDVDRAYAKWKANCGPCALAAAIGKPLAKIRDAFPRFPAQPWANPTHVQEALDALGIAWRRGPYRELPDYGLAFLQLAGPWEAPGVPIGAAYRHTHWIAAARFKETMWVYDVNNGIFGPGIAARWLRKERWEELVMRQIVRNTEKATGWWIRNSIEVSR